MATLNGIFPIFFLLRSRFFENSPTFSNSTSGPSGIPLTVFQTLLKEYRLKNLLQEFIHNFLLEFVFFQIFKESFLKLLRQIFQNLSIFFISPAVPGGMPLILIQKILSHFNLLFFIFFITKLWGIRLAISSRLSSGAFHRHSFGNFFWNSLRLFLQVSFQQLFENFLRHIF